MTLEATKENGGCFRHWADVPDKTGRTWSVPLIPRVAHSALCSVGGVKDEPAHPVLAVVRHPYIRVVSAWRYLRMHEPWSTTWSGDWGEFTRQLLDSDPATLDRHLRPQVWFLDPAPEHIIRIHAIGNFLNVPRVNETPSDRPWPAWDQDTQRALHDYYAEDVAAYLAAWGSLVRNEYTADGSTVH